MKIETDSINLEFFAEDMRHFKINDSKELRKFIDTIRIEKSQEKIGFKEKKKDD